MDQRHVHTQRGTPHIHDLWTANVCRRTDLSVWHNGTSGDPLPHCRALRFNLLRYAHTKIHTQPQAWQYTQTRMDTTAHRHARKKRLDAYKDIQCKNINIFSHKHKHTDKKTCRQMHLHVKTHALKNTYTHIDTFVHAHVVHMHTHTTDTPKNTQHTHIHSLPNKHTQKKTVTHTQRHTRIQPQIHAQTKTRTVMIHKVVSSPLSFAASASDKQV